MKQTISPETNLQIVEKSSRTIGQMNNPKVVALGCFIFLFAFLLRSIFLDRIPHIGDQGRDYLVALDALEQRSLPLMGIPSSIPRFSQGPANVWFVMMSFILGGVSPFSPPLFSALVSSLGILSIFIILRRVSKSDFLAFSITLYLASSPLLVQQSRMPFYLFAVPFFCVVYFWFLSRARSLVGLFLASLSFGLLFQWELATAPLAICLLLSWRQVKFPWKQKLGMVGLGLIFGLFPQAVWDIQHQCAHLCTLGVWAGYRATSFFIPGSEHAIFQSGAIQELAQGIIKQWQALFGVLGVLFAGGAVVAIVRWRSLRHFILYKIALISFFSLALGIIFHGHPSEAYFPPFVVIGSMLSGYALLDLSKKWQKIITILFILSAFWQAYVLISSRFNAPSMRDSLEARDWIIRTSASKPIQLVSYDPDAKFETYLSFLRFLLRLKGVRDQSVGVRYVITFHDQSQLPILNAVVVHFGDISIARKSGEYY